MRTLLIFTLCLSHYFTFGQNLTLPAQMGIGTITSTSSGGEALFGNPAGLSSSTSQSFIAAFQNRYFWTGINYFGAGYVKPVKGSAYGLVVQDFGIPELRQQKASFAYGRMLWPNFQIGATFDYYRISAQDYGAGQVLSFSIGLQAKLSDELVLATYIVNPLRSMTEDHVSIPSILQFGASYTISDKVVLHAEVSKSEGFPYRLKMGLVYRPVDRLIIRTGISSQPANYHFGIGFKTNELIQVDVAGSYDFTLGMVFSGGVKCAFRSNKQ